jgi:sterol desaturase/sphingolipid hydroxylase (fatty acid hydroxylase superfamily)
MEHGEKSDLSAKVLGISSDGEQGLRSGPEQDAIKLSLVLIGNGCNLFWHGEDHVEVLGSQKLGLAILEPLSPGQRLAFWTVAIGAGVVSVALMAAVVTLLQMAAQNSSPADLDRSHDAMLPHRHRSAIVQAIIGAVAAEYIRYFQPRAIHFPAVALQVPG